VAQKKPRDYLQILKELTRLVRLGVASHHAVVESAVPMDAAGIGDFKAGLKSRFGDLTSEVPHEPVAHRRAARARSEAMYGTAASRRGSNPSNNNCNFYSNEP